MKVVKKSCYFFFFKFKFNLMLDLNWYWNLMGISHGSNQKIFGLEPQNCLHLRAFVKNIISQHSNKTKLIIFHLVNRNAISQMKKFRRRRDGDDLACRRSLSRPVGPAYDHQVEDVGRIRKFSIRQRWPATFQDQLLHRLVTHERLVQSHL